MAEVKTERESHATEAKVSKMHAPQPTRFSLAHISDLHLTTLEKTRISQLLSKRMLGYVSWHNKRRIVHRSDIVAALVKDLQITRPDHIAVTGDLTHLGLPQEFIEAGEWLTSLGSPDRITVIPGNHEAYVGNAWKKSLDLWGPYMTSDDGQTEIGIADRFPSLRIRDRVALIGLNTARPCLPFLAIGSLGKKQLNGLKTLLKKTGEAGLLRVVLIHHPPVPGTIKWRKRLTDSKPFCDILSSCGAELVLHGHAHFANYSELQTSAGVIPVIGAPSASELNPWAGRHAKYNIFQITRTGESCQLTMAVRGYDADSGRFVAEEETVLQVKHLIKP